MPRGAAGEIAGPAAERLAVLLVARGPGRPFHDSRWCVTDAPGAAVGVSNQEKDQGS